MRMTLVLNSDALPMMNRLTTECEQILYRMGTENAIPEPQKARVRLEKEET
jgi:hypothetical protein